MAGSPRGIFYLAGNCQDCLCESFISNGMYGDIFSAPNTVCDCCGHSKQKHHAPRSSTYFTGILNDHASLKIINMNNVDDEDGGQATSGLSSFRIDRGRDPPRTPFQAGGGEL